mmetsp:Transcript_58825/g.167277  ORF Transcript_58825/g.167277 Transcript_58825/m.167277 type:complete len:252 (+) Transcript_58825:513-1268(+)
MASQRSVMRIPRPRCSRSSSCRPMSARAASSSTRAGGPAWPQRPLRPSSCSQSTQSPRRAPGSRASTTRFRTTVSPGCSFDSSRSASARARASSARWQPRLTAAQPAASSRSASRSSAGPGRRRTSTSGRAAMRGSCSTLSSKKGLRSRCAGPARVKRPERRDSPTQGSSVTVPARSCCRRSPAPRKATHSSSSRSAWRCMASPSGALATYRSRASRWKEGGTMSWPPKRTSGKARRWLYLRKSRSWCVAG